MKRPNLIKVIVVFMAGLLITLGSLIFLRAKELNHFRKAARSAAAAREISSPEAPKPISSRHEAQSGSENTQGTGGIHAPIIVDSPDARDVSLERRPTKAEQTTASRRLPRTVTLQPGRNLIIRLGQSLSTDRNHAGDAFQGTLDSPLIVNGMVLAERGSMVRGEVAKARRARLLGAKSNLSLILTEISTSDGQKVQVETNLWEEKGTGKSIDTPRMAAGAALGAVMGALHGAARGAGFVSSERETASDRPMAMKKGSILLRGGSRIEFRLASAVTVTEKLNYR